MFVVLTKIYLSVLDSLPQCLAGKIKKDYKRPRQFKTLNFQDDLGVIGFAFRARYLFSIALCDADGFKRDFMKVLISSAGVFARFRLHKKTSLESK